MALNVGELVGYLRVDESGFDRGLDRAESRFRGFGAGITKMATGFGAAAALAIGGALIGAMAEQDVGARVAAQLGTGQESIAEWGKLAGEIYADNFGESLADVGDAITKIQRSRLLPEDASSDDIKALTEQALTLSGVFGQDMTKSVLAVQKMVANGLVPNAKAGFDLLTRGIQEGVDGSEDLLDTFNEYSIQFRDIGLSGPQAMGLLSQGLKGGARDADTVADALKEFAIRSKDASATSMEAFKTLGLNGKQMTGVFARGGPEAAKGLDTVLDKLRAMKDPVAQRTVAVQLFGTKGEDMAKALNSLDLTSAVQEMGKIDGATKKAGDTMAETASAKIESFKRQAITTFVDVLGGKVLPFIEKVAGELSTVFGPAVAAVSKWMSENSEVVGAVAAGLGILLTVVLAVAAAVKAWAVVQGILNAVLMANPLGLIVAALVLIGAALVAAWQKSETFRNIVKGVIDKVVGIFQGGKKLIGDIITGIGKFFTETIPAALRRAWDAIYNAVVGPWKAAFKWIRDTALDVVGPVLGVDVEDIKRRAANADIPNVGQNTSGYQNKPRAPEGARGLLFGPKVGGHVAVLAEAGQKEWALPDDKLRATMREMYQRGQASGGGIDYAGQGGMRVVRFEVGDEFRTWLRRDIDLAGGVEAWAERGAY